MLLCRLKEDSAHSFIFVAYLIRLLYKSHFSKNQNVYIVAVEAIWQEFLKIVREEAGSRVVETWFKVVQLTQWDAYNKVVYLQAPNPFVKNWITQNYTHLFKQHLSRLLNEHDISVVITEKKQKEDDTSPQETTSDQSKDVQSKDDAGVPYRPPMALRQQKKKKASLVSRKNAVRRVLNEQYVFDSFVVGASNKLAFAAIRAAAENLGNLYNPLFIYGGSGLGKTHLLHAMGNYVQQMDKNVSILYQPADRFVHEFINAIRFNKIYQFESKYKDVDLLLVDDIQFISRKEQTQEAFFHIFNRLHQANKQIVFTSDAMPCDIAGLAERMRSRLEGGLIADIQLPALETMVAILQKKAAAQDVSLPYDVAYYIASYGFSNIRELEGALIRIMAFSSLTGDDISVALAERVLVHKKEQRNVQVGLQDIAQIVARYFKITLELLRSTQRKKEISSARHVAMYFMKRLTKRSLKDIALFFNRKDHSTVLHAVEKVRQLYDQDATFAQTIQEIEQRMYNR
jgi:chromosomal replication initiator protein